MAKKKETQGVMWRYITKDGADVLDGAMALRSVEPIALKPYSLSGGMMTMRKVKWCSELVNIPGVNPRDYEKETAFQIYCADWLRKQYIYTGLGWYDMWHHSANERIGARAGFTARMMGQSKGFPDLVHYGLKLAIELKVPGNKPTKDQERWLAYLRTQDYQTEVVYSFEKFREIVLARVLALSREG